MYFNEQLHKYTDDFSREYISVTTLIGKYSDKFETEKIAERCEKIGKNPNHPKYEKYKNKNKKQIIAEWDRIRDDACELGTERHNYLETGVKIATGYKLIENTNFINDKIYTIDDIVKDHNFGLLDLNKFRQQGIEENYPEIFNDLTKLKTLGWRLYSEICTYSSEYLISGLIDILAVKDNNFMILDWKTNRADIKFESGYFIKDINGKLTKEFKRDNKVFKYPLHYLEQSVGNKYTMQLSLYAYLTEQFGMKYIGGIIYHIRHEKYNAKTAPVKEYIDKQKVDKVPTLYMIKDIEKLLSHYYKNNKEIYKLGN